MTIIIEYKSIKIYINRKICVLSVFTLAFLTDEHTERERYAKCSCTTRTVCVQLQLQCECKWTDTYGLLVI